ncbi:uncharacterized protein LOC18434021 [Amborella trichopoda]|uniref:Ribosomal RNA-processing protein 7 C-terminal domain-containing protein n=1 Tax=Amborella trichopoda TaxID=13333 RepID=W1PDQ1_AMBTC|nr:uncharacterized protein LOC18434021 [Amborella trichopoda]XP_011623266.1 uncharacterized protein LOC18434021 [Amborella trichopoda]XP_011623267.1 uncharacterized protein LOC18434021 [Amborella trichopoda]XP_020522716.1 uncharacterized protein LOC18434021 [Amborella trichopoda]XP_020522717.1 uncharacterized protein LOC18434021 [Amborella trichopoda]XP_020522718.1 uncharacterized protein LOC18434021 [Amborella trichopoda]XP_020522719.1 uncharacterized protein LOC18434021 [Amborella trichopod|eukprot:XP_006844159.1 uncharacterized protein LOC18434021 [Amborella trichopoda]
MKAKNGAECKKQNGLKLNKKRNLPNVGDEADAVEASGDVEYSRHSKLWEDGNNDLDPHEEHNEADLSNKKARRADKCGKNDDVKLKKKRKLTKKKNGTEALKVYENIPEDGNCTSCMASHTKSSGYSEIQTEKITADCDEDIGDIKMSKAEKKKKKDKLSLKNKRKFKGKGSEVEIAEKVDLIVRGIGTRTPKSDVKLPRHSSHSEHKGSKASHTGEASNLVSQEGSLLEVEQVDQISSGDEDCSRGMKKWIMEYHCHRPGLEVLQQRIDAFIAEHEAQEEKARKEREEKAAAGGWTVVVHHKGRKKTTDAESGVSVGSVAQAAIMDKMAKKKSKEAGLNFYRFQKREAHRNELMMLQNKFEQDKKRIQELRAARKFRPY